MSSLLFLTSEDFYINSTPKGNFLCTDIRGLSLVLFYSTQCVYCQNLIPLFKDLPNQIQGCQFIMVNITNSRKIVDMAHTTVSPITFVPDVLLYFNGVPKFRYDGEKKIEKIKEFLLLMYQQLRNNNTFVSHPHIKHGDTKKIPEYCTGHPKCEEDGRCYLEYDEAYVKENK